MIFSRDVLPILLVVLVLGERGLSIGHICTQSVQVVVICHRRVQFGPEEIGRVLGVAVRYSHISD